jgi:rRNA maturation endonuclease Nob1
MAHNCNSVMQKNKGVRKMTYFDFDDFTDDMIKCYCCDAEFKESETERMGHCPDCGEPLKKYFLKDSKK